MLTRQERAQEIEYPRNPPDCMARLDINTDIKNQSAIWLIIFGLIGLIPALFLFLAQVSDECLSELERRWRKS